MKRFIIACALLSLAVACATPVAQNNSDALASIAREYPNWTRLFDAPRNVSIELMTLCRLVLEDEQAYLDSEHAQYFVQVYVNPLGEKTMREQGARTFPEGTIIVKEKWKRDQSFAQDKTATRPAGLGIMHKAKDGWQYA